MKYIYKSILAVVLLIGAICANAQTKQTFGDNKTHRATVITSENMNVRQVSDNNFVLSSKNERINNQKSGKATHNFKIDISDGDWQEIHVASDDDYLFDMMVWEGDGFNEVVEEGYYDIFIVGYMENTMCVLTYDQIPVFENVEFNASFNDCIYSLNLDGTDQNGNSLADLEYVMNDYLVDFEWRNHLKSFANMLIFYPFYLQEIPDMRFSNCDERSGVMVVANLHTADHVVYNITFPYQYGISDNVILGNEFEKLTGHTECYYVDDSETSYYHNDFMTFFGENHCTGLLAWNGNLTIDACQPILFYSDTRTDDPTDFSNGAITLDLPSFFENHHNFTYPYENKIAPFGFYHNGEGKLVREPFGKTIDDFNNMTPSYLDWFPFTPATVYSDPGETLYFGERTPMIYNQPYVVKPEYSESGKYGVQVHVLPIGENGCMRFGDMDASFVMTLDGEEVFNDTLIDWPSWDELQVENPCYVDYEIRCNHLSVDGVEKSNFTFMEFDLSNDDVTPPTMTFLQVKDAYDKECIELTDLSRSTICFAAGDFSPHYTEEGGNVKIDYMQYDGRPELGVSYRYGNIDWIEMNCTEDVDLFHENYGNVFTINLEQLDSNVANNWVSLMFIFVDDAGNVQQQELSNVFFAGEITSVNEITANSLSHSVYPNPFSSSVTINAVEPVNGVATFTVYNTLGEMVYGSTMNCSETTEFRWNAADNANGVYLYQISTEKGMIQGRVVKE